MLLNPGHRRLTQKMLSEKISNFFYSIGRLFDSQTTLGPVDCQAFKDAVGHSDGDYGQWAYPDVEDMAQRILAAVALPGASGLVGSDYVRQQYCWDLAADKILHFLHALGQDATRTLAHGAP